jgi:hypothetical protein
MTITDDQLAQLLAGIRAAQPAPTPTICPVCDWPVDQAAGAPVHPGCIQQVVDTPLDQQIRAVVQAAGDGAARSQQRRIGPSEIGIACDRFIGYKMLDIDPVNVGRDNWLAILGTAMHAWLENAFAADNARLGVRRWLTEKRVWLNSSLSGSCDLYDSWSYTVIDHKLLGTTSQKKIAKNGPPPKYRTQLHSYGYGYARAGHRVERVALACYPRNDTLRGDFGGNKLLIWSEPYDEQVALDALARIAKVTETAAVLDLEHHPERWPLIPATPGQDCTYCPFYRPGGAPADGTGCPGHTTATPTLPAHIPGLI